MFTVNNVMLNKADRITILVDGGAIIHFGPFGCKKYH